MATTVVSHTYKLKRGNEDAVLQANPLLERGEPIVVWLNDGTVKLKVGDGTNYYRDLPFEGEEWIYNADTAANFPNIGKSTVLYKAEKTSTLYQWNTAKHIYEPIGNSSGPTGPITTSDILDFDEVVDAKIEEEAASRILADAKLGDRIDSIDAKIEDITYPTLIYGGSAEEL